MDRYDPEYIDDEEKELIESLESIDPESISRPTAAEQKGIQEAAQAFEEKELKMNIRISPYELQRIKEKAAEEGLKYQTFVKSILHKYLTGQLVDRERKAG